MFESEKIKELANKYEMGKLAHAFLLETNNCQLCLKDIKMLLEIINCPKKYTVKCQEQCNLCKLIEIDNLPSIITIYPDGMSIKKVQLQELQDKFSMKPVYSRYNSYIIMNADTMNASASNSILKFIEEPEEHILGFFITSNKENVIETIKSRCQIIKVNYKDKINNNEITDVCIDYLQKILYTNDVLVNRELLRDFQDRSEIYEIFKKIFDIYVENIKKNYFPGNKIEIFQKISDELLLKQITIVENILQLIQSNVNLELLLDKFVIEMRRSK